jgi:phosphoribosyl-dephospho-CoA transferase
MHPGMNNPLQRHRLVRISSAAWQRIVGTATDEQARAWLADWGAFDWPLVVRRAFMDEQDRIALGIPLPPSAGKRRLAVNVDAQDVVSVRSLPTLGDVIAFAPAAWRPCLQSLYKLAQAYDVNAGVFGSLAWQFLTGEIYLTPASDLDIAWSMPAAESLREFLQQLARVESDAPMRLDGEIIRADGAAVNWREIWLGHRTLAVKTCNAVADWTPGIFLRGAA